MKAVLWMAALALGLLGAAVRGQEKPEELSEKERKALQQKAAELDQQAFANYQKGRIDEAIRLEKQRLTLCRRLYPEGKTPTATPSWP
jgi:hypothetical protein